MEQIDLGIDSSAIVAFGVFNGVHLVCNLRGHQSDLLSIQVELNYVIYIGSTLSHFAYSRSPFMLFMRLGDYHDAA